jgi:hypothetical protein
VNDHALQIQSFRVVFELERRIHRIDRFKIPLPYGLPLRTLGYTLAALVVVLAASGLPGIGAVVEAVPAPLRFVILPVGVGIAMTRLRLDGRSAHAASLAWLTYTFSPRDLVAFRRRPAREEIRLSDLLIATATPGPARTTAAPSGLSQAVDSQMELW